MEITRKCPFTGKVNTKDINVTPTQLHVWQNMGVLIQDAMPQLSADDREFIKTGITPEVWEQCFGGDDD